MRFFLSCVIAIALATVSPTRPSQSTPTVRPTDKPSDPTPAPTQQGGPTPETRHPTPYAFPTSQPTHLVEPTPATTRQPTDKPSQEFPTNAPTQQGAPTPATRHPTDKPSQEFPTNAPTQQGEPTPATRHPTDKPTQEFPTYAFPTSQPTQQGEPTPATRHPTDKPSQEFPTNAPTRQGEPTPATRYPTDKPTQQGEPTPATRHPTEQGEPTPATRYPTDKPTQQGEPTPATRFPTDKPGEPTPATRFPTDKPTDKPGEPTPATRFPTDKPGNPTPATRFPTKRPTDRTPTKQTLRPTPARPPTKEVAPTKPTKPLAPTKFPWVFPSVAGVLVRTDIVLNVTNGTCGDVRVFATKVKTALVRILNVPESAISVSVANCDSRRLLSSNTVVITTEATLEEAEGIAVITEAFVAGPDFITAAAESQVAFGAAPEASSTTAVNECGVSFQSFTATCQCPMNMTELSHCPNICAQSDVTDCKDSLELLANCTTDAGLGSLVTAVRARFGQCPAVNSAFQVSVGMLSILVWLNI